MEQEIRAGFEGRQRRVERVSQASVEVVANNLDQAFLGAREILIGWLAQKAGSKLPPEILDGRTGEFDVIGFQRVETAALDEPLYWAARQDDQDKNLPRRTWVTEAALARTDNRLVVGHRLHCVTLGEAAPFGRSVPRFLREIARNYTTCLDGEEVTLSAKAVTSQEDVAWLIDLLRSPNRKHPVIGVSQSFRAERSGEGYAVDANAIANAVFGTAHVFAISNDATDELVRVLGRDLAVFNGGVRSWRYPFGLEDSKYAHPLATHRHIDSWQGGAGAAGFSREIVDWALRHSAGRRDAERLLPPFAEVRHAVALRQRAAAAEDGRTDQELMDLALADNDRLAQELTATRDEHAQLLELADEDSRRLQIERDDALSEQNRLVARIKTLESALRNQRHTEEVPIPDDLAQMRDWSDAHLGDGVIVLPRAVSAAKKSPFEDTEYVYRVLLSVRDHYVPMRRTGSPDHKDGWEAAMAELGLQLTPSFAGSGAGEFGDEYRVQFEGGVHLLDMHLKGCSSRDPRFGFRCYFFWDDVGQRAVIGSLPGHLTTRAT